MLSVKYLSDTILPSIHTGNAAAQFGQAASDFDAFDPRSASEFIYEACAASPGEITLVSIGPLTNIAAALEAHPDLPDLAKEVVIMGGAVLGELRGNRTPAAEANFAHDPKAAQAVLTAGFKSVVLADLGVTHQTDLVALRDRCLAGADAGSVVPRFIQGVSQCFIDAYTKSFGAETAPVHDAVPIMYILHPDFFTKRAARVEVETHGVLTKGCSVADWRGRWGKPVNCEVLVTLDRAKFDQAFVDAIGTLWHRSDLPAAAVPPPAT